MDYQTINAQFTWDGIRDKFVGNPDELMNVAVEVCDKWAEKDRNSIAIQWEDEAGQATKLTFGELKDKSNQIANALKGMGIKQGDRVAGLLAKEVELAVAIIAVLKMGAIYVPLFTAFGPDGILHRAKDAGISLLITDQTQADKIKGQSYNFNVWCIDKENEQGQNFWTFIDSHSKDFIPAKTKGNDPAIIQYTSGTTGLPKGAMLAHKMMFSLYPYFKEGLALTDEDIFFGGADLGWAYGLVACTLGPLSFGATTVLYKGAFHPVKTLEILDKYQVTNFAHAPTAYRFIKSIGTDNLKNFNIVVKKFNSAGEPIDGEVVKFFQENYGRAIYDHYGATEVSMMINNYNSSSDEIKPGSMGFPSPGFNVKLIDDAGHEVKQGQVGNIAIDSSNQHFGFLGYWNNEEKLKEKMIGTWFLTGDLALQDADGYFWFQGRSDDVISSAGYRIGPTEVEASLMAHPDVVEAAVVGKPDKEKGEVVKAFVLLNPNAQASESLKEELTQSVKNKLSKHQYPREIEFVEDLPKTQSGKIQRFKLKQAEVEKYNA